MGTYLVGSSGVHFRFANLANPENRQFMKIPSGTGDKVAGDEPLVSATLLRRPGLKSWQLWIGVSFSVGFLVLTLRNVDLVETAKAMSRVNILILGAAVFSYVLSIAAKTIRWQLLLSIHKSPSFGQTFSIFSIGQMMNAFLPAHLGEFARAYLMGEAESDSKVYVLGTVVVERLADLLLLLISLTILLSQVDLPAWLASPGRSFSVLLIILVPCVILLAWQRNLVLRAVSWISRFAPTAWRGWLVKQAHFGLASLDTVRRPRLLIGLFIWSTIVCILSTLTNYLVFLALELAVPVWVSLLLLVVLQIGTAVPSSPGRIGVFQYLVILALSIIAMDKNVALGYSVLLYLVIYVPITLIGIYCLWRIKITWQTLEEAASMLKRLRSRVT
jgi:glycosyltransferase 2 family protein